MKYNEINDFELVYMIKEKNEDAYEIAFSKYKPLIDKIVNKYLVYGEKYGLDFDDLYQAGLMGITYAIEHYNERINAIPYTFIQICVKGKIISLIRCYSAKKYTTLNDASSFTYSCMDSGIAEYDVAGDLSIVDDVIAHELEEYLYKYQFELSQEQASIYELKRNGFSNMEISSLLDISVKTVCNSIYIIKNKLKRHLEKLNYI